MKIAAERSRPAASQGKRKARVCALQILFQAETARIPLDEVLADFWKNRRVSPRTRTYAERLARLAVSGMAEWDAVIEKSLKNWKKERLASVDLAILRLAAAEHAASGAPRNVIIDEAVEIAKQYGTENSAKFVNGVLDKMLSKDVSRAA